MVTLVGTLGVYSTVNAAFNPTDGPQMPPISEVSGESEAALARHLKQVGAVMYGAYWCPHCQDQKRLFGEKAAQIINYVECSPNGPNAPQAEACQAKEIRSYPTWEINGQLQEPGVIRLEQLAELTNYQGPRNFQISLPTVP
jgi:glutaredoxin